MILSPFVPKPMQLLRVRNYQSLPLRDKWDLPRVSGIYYCLRGWKVLYVGKSSNINARWNSYRYGEHHKLEELLRIDESIGDIDLHYCEWPEPLIGFIEAIEIKRFDPPMNKRYERVWDNINLSVLAFILRAFFTQTLIFLLSISVLGLLAYHLLL